MLLRLLILGGLSFGAFAQTDPLTLPTPRPSAGAHQYGIELLRLDRAWQITRGRAHISLADGDGPMAHEDLGTGLAGNFRDHASDAPSPQGDFYHSMLVAGVMSARGFNGKGIAGACPSCSFTFHRISGSAFPAGLRAALASGASAVNLSLGYGAAAGEVPIVCSGPLPASDRERCDAVQALEDRDVVLVSIAQNYGQAKLPFPANVPTVIPVGGVQPDGRFWTEGYDQLVGSNYGPGLRLVAPARDVLSTHLPNTYLYGYPPYRCGERVDSTLGSARTLSAEYAGYGDCTGTSFAAPWVTAIAGLVRSADPLLSAAAVRRIIDETATVPVAGPAGSGLTFYLPDAEAALRRTLGGGTFTVNRATPLFSLYSPGSSRHLFTSSPTTAVAAAAGELPVRRLATRATFQAFGDPVLGYAHHAGRICTAGNCAPPIEARTGFSVYALEKAPIAGNVLVPLYRLSQACSAGPGCATTRAFAYATSEAGVRELEGRGYVVDVVEGYLHPPDSPAPAGTIPVCLAYDEARIDHILYARSQCDRAALQDSAGNTTGGNYRTVAVLGHAPNLNLGLSTVENRTGLWWNPAESGWGINFAHQGNVIFATLFTYDASGKPVWLVMPEGRLTGATDSFSGALYRTSGSPPGNGQFPPISATLVGSLRVTFTGADAATLEYEFNGVAVRKSIRKQVFGDTTICRWIESRGPAAGNYQDLWWNPAESGWGLNIAHQGNVIFATLFTYAADRSAAWYVMSAGRRQADGSYVGDLHRIVAGSAFNAEPFTPISAANVVQAGTMRLAFSDGVSGVLTYSVDGATISRPITRQVFGAPVPVCSSASPAAP